MGGAINLFLHDVKRCATPHRLAILVSMIIMNLIMITMRIATRQSCLTCISVTPTGVGDQDKLMN